jgi:HD-like signal output (HDOD) protein
MSAAESFLTQALITQAPISLQGWARLFDHASLPVLQDTAQALQELALVEDQVDAHLLADVVTSDPLLTLKLLAHVAHLRRGREGSEVETVTEALVMLGIPPFFRAFVSEQAPSEAPPGGASEEAPPTKPSLLMHTPQQQLASLPADVAAQALQGFEAVLLRSRRAARFATAFAVHRMDHDAAVIHEAALLHDFTHLLLWLRAPQLALAITQRQAADPQLRSSAVQRELLNIDLAELQHSLLQSWRLPTLLVRISDDHSTQPTAQVRNVQLAIRVARHSAQGWDNPALPDDVTAIASLLHLGAQPTLRLLREIDAGAG